MDYTALITIETVAGSAEHAIRDERFEDGDIIKADGTAVVRDGAFVMPQIVELEDYETKQTLTYQRSVDGWFVDKETPWKTPA